MAEVRDKAKKRLARLQAAAEHDDEEGQVHPVKQRAVVKTAATCSACGADLHSCTNCRYFDSSAPLECRKEPPARVAGKAKNNDCQLFEAKVTQEFGSDSGRPADPKAAFDALFDL